MNNMLDIQFCINILNISLRYQSFNIISYTNSLKKKYFIFYFSEEKLHYTYESFFFKFKNFKRRKKK